MEAVIAKIDPVIDRMEKALEKIALFQDKRAKLPGAEFDLLKQLEDARDIMWDCLKKSDGHKLLEDVFGGDCVRIKRIQEAMETLDERPLSNMNCNDQRLKGAHDGCDSVIKVLEDMGYGWLLRSRVNYGSKKTGEPYKGEAFTVGTPIDPIMPQSASADFTTITIDKELPPGLSFDKTTGEISGTPTAESPPTEYTITFGGNTGKPVTCILNITVLPKPIIPPGKDGFMYDPPSKSYLIDTEGANWPPTLIGGDPADEFTIIPALPAGLVIDKPTGVISGTPSEITDLSVFTVTAKNKGGAKHCKITLEVNPQENDLVQRIIACTEPEQLEEFQAQVEEEKKDKKPFNWMIWMVHRAHLNDPTLTKFDFTGLQMPTGVNEPLISPKLMVAIASNDKITELLLPSTNFQSHEAVVLAQSMQENATLKILNIESNPLPFLALETVARGLGENKALEQFRCNNIPAARPVYEAILEMLRKNIHIVKLGMEVRDVGTKGQIDRQLTLNTDAARKARVAAKKAAEAGYPVAS